MAKKKSKPVMNGAETPAPSTDEKLTVKQENFVLAYLSTGNASEAYRRAYDAENMSAEAINVEACRLLQHPNVALRLAGLQKRAEAKAILTLEEHMAELQTLRDLAKQNAQLSAAIKAEELRGKLRRFYVEQIETGTAGAFADMSDAELDAFLAEDDQPPKPATPKANGRANGRLNGNGRAH